jgi:hypothetical protein
MAGSNTDKHFLQQLGCIENNSLVNIINPNLEENENDGHILISHSSYYHHDNLISTLTRNKNQFSILSTNIECISAKFDELKMFIEILKQSNLEFSAICIQETWLVEGVDTSQIQLEGYT